MRVVAERVAPPAPPPAPPVLPPVFPSSEAAVVVFAAVAGAMTFITIL